MHATNAATDHDVLSSASLDDELGADHSLRSACLRAGELIRDFFSRGSPAHVGNAKPTDVSSLATLFDELEAEIRLVARTRASSFIGVGHKRALQDLLRQHRGWLGDLLATVGRSVDEDMRQLLARSERPAPAWQGGGWLGRRLTAWKQRPHEDRSQPSLVGS